MSAAGRPADRPAEGPAIDDEDVRADAALERALKAMYRFQAARNWGEWR